MSNLIKHNVVKSNFFDREHGKLNQKMEFILNRRIQSKKRVAISDMIDTIHRFAIRGHSVLRNKMYYKLLSGNLSRNGYEAFFENYYHSYSRDLFWIVLRSALDINRQSWSSYIKSNIEENYPRVNSEFLKCFIEDCGLSIKEPIIAPSFTNSILKAFTSDISFALGYCLAIEVESAYQVDLIKESCRHQFPQSENAIWFSIHLDSIGKEETNYTVEVIEMMVNIESDNRRLRQGFLQACDDIYNFMESLHDYIVSEVDSKVAVLR
jgi:hypothetical protein